MTAATKPEALDAEIVQPAYHAPAVVDQQAAMLSMIERVALNPDLPIERLNQLLDMKERIDDRAREERARDAEAAYYEAMAACQVELKEHPVIKNKDNTQTHSKYADLAAISKAVDAVIHRHGFMVSFQPGGKNEAGDEIVRYTIAGKGHVERGEAVLPTDDKGPKGEVNKTKLHGFGSTMSYGRRYLKLMLFDIATGDDDDGNKGGATGSTISADQFRNLRDLIGRAGADEAKFLATLKVSMLEELPASRYDAATTMLWQKIAQPVVKGAQP
jgi:hypothetical protein